MTANKTSQALFFYVQVKPRHPREKFCVKLTRWSFCWHWKHANNVPQKTDARTFANGSLVYFPSETFPNLSLSILSV